MLVADIEELEQMDASEIYATRLNAKEVLAPMGGEKFIFPIADGTVKLSGGDQFYLPSSRGTQSQTVRAERRIISYSTEIYRRCQKYRQILGCTVGEKH